MIAVLGDDEPVLEGGGHFIAGNATVIGRVRLGDASSVWFNAVLRGDNDLVDVGRMSNVQDGAILHTDPGLPLTVGAGVTIGHKAMLHGCTIGDGSLVGIGATVLNRARIGAHCLLGAHALVTEGKEFPDGVLIIGAPARIARELTAEEIEGLDASAPIYVDTARRARSSLRTQQTL
jgi:carbonic anhydrase/acetyltransferase-like protein (isoleucine patch superfamily)